MFKVFAAVVSLTCATAAQASTINLSTFDPDAYGAIASGFNSATVENFEGYEVGNVADGFSTSVGTFATIGGVGTGGTVSKAGFTNDGSQLALRNGNVFGRVSTTQLMTGDRSDGMFLDSNDTFGIVWNASLGGVQFRRILLTLTDAADVGARMVVSNGLASTTFESAGNGNRQTVLIAFDEAVSSASIFFENRGGNGNRINDGFSIDDIAVSAVPIPASLAFMLAALGMLGWAGRRRQA